MLGAIVQSSREGNPEMKRSTANGEEAPHAKRKRVQPEDLDTESTHDCVQFRTIAEEQDSIVERPYSTQVKGRSGDSSTLLQWSLLFSYVVYLFNRCDL